MKIEEIKQQIISVLKESEQEKENIAKAVDDILKDVVQDFLKKEGPKKKVKRIKEKGIALTCKDQGYSANNRPISLLMKSNLKKEQLTEDIIKLLEHFGFYVDSLVQGE